MEAIRLEPLAESYLDAVAAIVDDPEVQRSTRVPVPVPAGFPRAWFGHVRGGSPGRHRGGVRDRRGGERVPRAGARAPDRPERPHRRAGICRRARRPRAAASDRMPERVAALRAFSRFYTTVIGLLQEGLLETPYSLTEARVIFELAQRDQMDVADLRRTLDLDPGYLSRIRGRLEEAGLVTRARSGTDGRRHVIGLTARGRAAFATLDARSSEQATALVGRLGEDEQRRLVAAMDAVQQLLGDRPPASAVLRAPGPGHLRWVVERHGALYAEEYGWDESFEALVARVVADFAATRDPGRERAWIADVGGGRAGCVLCVRSDERVGQLRLLLVEPVYRGMGIGRMLVDECLRFARGAGYDEMILWTNDVLVDARRIYERAGFELREEEPHTSFGHELVGQIWGR